MIESLPGDVMHRTIYYVIAAGILLIPNGFGVVFAYAHDIVTLQDTDSYTAIYNDISVETNTGNTVVPSVNGIDGIDGADGANGTDGSGSDNITTGTSQALVEVVNVVNGGISTSSIDIQTGSSTNAVIEKHQVITGANGATVVQNTVSVKASGSTIGGTNDTQALSETNASDAKITDTPSGADSADLEAPEQQKTTTSGQTNPIIGILIAVVNSVVAFVSSLFNLF